MVAPFNHLRHGNLHDYGTNSTIFLNEIVKLDERESIESIDRADNLLINSEAGEQALKAIAKCGIRRVTG